MRKPRKRFAYNRDSESYELVPDPAVRGSKTDSPEGDCSNCNCCPSWATEIQRVFDAMKRSTRNAN